MTEELFEIDPNMCLLCEETFSDEEEVEIHMWTGCPHFNAEGARAGAAAGAAAATSLLAPCETCGASPMEVCLNGTLCESRRDKGIFAGLTEAMAIEQAANNKEES